MSPAGKAERMARRVGIALLLAAAIAGAIRWYWRSIPPAKPPAGAGTLAPPPAEITTVTGNPIRTPAEVEAATPAGILHFADALNALSQTPAADTQLLLRLMDLYRSVLHTTDPVGDNEEITVILTGNNHLGYAFIPPGSKAINPQGQLCDRWGTPYFFHQISGTQMQIRSGGPDGKLWTKDDIVSGP